MHLTGEPLWENPDSWLWWDLPPVVASICEGAHEWKISNYVKVKGRLFQVNRE